MKFKFQHNELVPDLPYIPKKVTNTAMLTYMAALLACSVLFNNYALEIRWMLFGIIEVVGFFFLSNHLSKSWINIRPKAFIKNVFWLGFALRVAWVIISYLLYQKWTGTAFSIAAADEFVYDASAHEIAQGMRDGNWNLFGLAQFAMGKHIGISDLGYPIYLGIIYFIYFDSILIARIIKAIFGAWTAVLVYKLASRNFGEYTGRMAAIMCMLMPNLIYYCSMQLKEVEMVFLAMLFIERADALLRLQKMPWRSLLLLMLIPLYMFMIRTALAATLVMGFAMALLLTSDRVVKGWRRVMLIGTVGVFGLVLVASESNIITDVQQMWEVRGSTQKEHAEWRAKRKDQAGLQQRFAKYAGATVFAPAIFTVPFPTMAETPGQENQKMIHGGNYVKNIISFFTIAALFIMLLSGNWRRYVLPVSILCGYLVVLVFSNFAHSERFHLPILPLHLMLAAYGISQIHRIPWLKRVFPWWCALMFVAALAWNWLKLAGRGMI